MRHIDLESERLFENAKALGGDARASQSKFYWSTALETKRHSETVFNRIKNKTVLEIGCASGSDAVFYCKFAAQYIGVDISDEAIRNSKSKMLENANFICNDGHELPVKDKTVDCVIVNSLLHHMDLEKISSEIIRVLKDGGELLFREPLGTNPVFQLYRRLTPKARTIDERPFSFEDLRVMQRHFEFESVIWYGFLSLISAYIRINSIRMLLTNLDRLLSKTPLKFFFWQLAGVARKKK